jgi:hypothetical protein
VARQVYLSLLIVFKKKLEDDMLAIQRKSDEQGKLIAHLYELIKGRGLNIDNDIPPPN